MNPVFRYERTRGGLLWEEFRDGAWYMCYRDSRNEQSLYMYSPSRPESVQT